MSSAGAPQVANSVLGVLRRYWWFLALVLAIALGATYFITKQQTPTYSASTTVTLRTNETLPLFPLASTGPEELKRGSAVEELYTATPEFLDVVREQTPKGVSVRTRSASSELIFTARGEDPEAVAEAANIWADTYIQERHKSVLAELDEDAQFVQSQIDELDSQRSELRTELDALEELIESTTDADQVSRLLVQRSALEQSLAGDLDPLNQQIANFKRELASFELIGKFLDSDDVSARVLKPASVPSSPVSPNLLRNLALGGLLGSALGFGLPYLRETLRDKVDERDDIVTAASLGVLASIPSFSAKSPTAIESIDRPSSQATEHYQALLTAIEFAAIDDPLRSILFTSAEPGEGKTTTAVNVAALASQFMNVLLIDADMRRPSIHKITELSNRSGLANVLEGGAEFFEVRQRFSRNDTSFDVLTSGPAVDDPALLLRGQAWSDLLDQLFLYDLVVVDGPPVLAVTDALLIGRAVDAQALLVRSGTTDRSTLADASELLSTNGTRTLGAVVNRASLNSSSYRYYGKYRSDDPVLTEA